MSYMRTGVALTHSEPQAAIQKLPLSIYGGRHYMRTSTIRLHDAFRLRTNGGSMRLLLGDVDLAEVDADDTPVRSAPHYFM
jgi:hypothetical protein